MSINANGNAKGSVIGAELKDKHPGLIINFIIDESGSMSSAVDQTIKGFNEYVQNRKESREASRPGSVFFSLTKFSNRAEVIYAAKDIHDVEPLSHKNYRPDGSTALLDAMGKTIDTVDDAIKDWNNKPAILTVVMTDGYENASSDYKHEQIKQKIAEKEKEGNWTFVFLGATLDTMNVAQSYGIARGNVQQYDTANIGNVMRGLSASTAKYACSASKGVMQTESFFDAPDSADDFVEDDNA